MVGSTVVNSSEDDRVTLSLLSQRFETGASKGAWRGEYITNREQ